MLARLFLVLLFSVAVLEVIVILRIAERSASAKANFPPIGLLINVGGTQAHAYVAGHRSNAILIHGASGNLRDFTFELTEHLTDRFRVNVFDHPGLGYAGHMPDAAAERGENPREQVDCFMQRTIGSG